MGAVPEVRSCYCGIQEVLRVRSLARPHRWSAERYQLKNSCYPLYPRATGAPPSFFSGGFRAGRGSSESPQLDVLETWRFPVNSRKFTRRIIHECPRENAKERRAVETGQGQAAP